MSSLRGVGNDFFDFLRAGLPVISVRIGVGIDLITLRSLGLP